MLWECLPHQFHLIHTRHRTAAGLPWKKGIIYGFLHRVVYETLEHRTAIWTLPCPGDSLLHLFVGNFGMILIILASLSSSPPFCSAESVLVGQVWNIRRTSLICSYVPSSSEAISLFPLWMFSCHSCSPDSSPSSMQCILMLTVLQGKSSK